MFVYALVHICNLGYIYKYKKKKKSQVFFTMYILYYIYDIEYIQCTRNPPFLWFRWCSTLQQYKNHFCQLYIIRNAYKSLYLLGNFFAIVLKKVKVICNWIKISR